MDNYIKEQENLYGLLAKTITNYKKSPKQRLTRGYVQLRMETLTDYWTKFHNNHLEMLKLVSKQDRGQFEYFTKDYFLEMEELYIDLRSDMMDLLSTMNVRSGESTPSSYNPLAATSVSDEVRLPKINIPQYSGSYHEWNSFHDLYTSLIHNKTTLTKVQKMHYLKSCLSGEAELLLKHVPITESNYDIAWNILTQRYNNKRIIVNTILTRLVNQRKLTTGTAKGLRDLLDTTSECLNKLKNQDIPVDTWDILVVHIIVNKMDSESHKEWESELGSLDISELPTLNMLKKFLEKRFRVMEMIQAPTSCAPVNKRSFHVNKVEQKCIFCNQDHMLYTCKEFSKLAVDKRVEYVQGWRLCFNCLVPGHSVKFCKHRSSCRRCGRKHHSLLHSTWSPQPETPPKSLETSSPILQNKEDIQEEKEDKNKKNIISHLTMGSHAVMMPTALVQVNTVSGEKHLMRALLDPCSQESFITESAAQKLRARRTSISGHVTGVDQMKTPLKYAAEIQFSSRIEPEMNMKVTAYVVRHITDIMPAKEVKVENWQHIEKLCLADPTCHTPGHIDLLLGVEVCTEVIKPGVIKGPSGSPIAQDSHLGWIVSGNARTEHTATKNIVSMHLNVDLNNMLKKFWELETIEEENHTLTSDEKKAEDIFEKTHKRKEDGRYVVRLPFKEESPVLPRDSRDIAVKRWIALERRLYKTPQLKNDYNNVLQEYLDLQHMEKVGNEEIPKNSVYLPFHAVVREDKETTRVRIVFNASSAGTNGVTLNDALLVGPTLQEDLRDILLRWRTHKIAYVADIVKMYRQIEVDEADRDYQRIVWRSDAQKPIEDYRLISVTFGTACAPYLAIKTLRQVALDEGQECTEAQRIILEDFYMDDLLSGHETEDKAKRNQKEITGILKKGGFELQKWSSNSENFMKEIELMKRSQNTQREVDGKDSIKTLGILWNTKDDKLKITNNMKDLPAQPITKRNVLADIASLFDPMGWLAPSVVIAKTFMQKLWTLGVGWDEELADDLIDEWLKFRNEIPALTDVQINRWIHTTSERSSVELHGFADASMRAYAAVVYTRVTNPDGQIKVSLLTAKTKAAPLKQVSMPRLELCGAVLLCRLLKHIVSILKLQQHQVFAWSDSQAVLAWIKGDPGRWTPFVKNRVTEISKMKEINGWYYVNTKHNPADPASRGVMPKKLLTTLLWWNGPAFLGEPVIELPGVEVPETELECRKNIKSLVTTSTTRDDEEDLILTLIRRYSSLGKLVRIIAYCRRWRLHLQRKQTKEDHLPTYLTTEERDVALTICLRRSQEVEFPEEIHDLKSKKQLKRKSRLLSLTPFLDPKGMLRVGGRLRNADIGAQQKHPIIITKDNALVPLLLAEAHSSTLHGGPQLMAIYLRSKYWLLNVTNKVKKYVRNCIVCIRQRGETCSQLMGDLPAVRVTPAKPFLISGVDFAGPINVRMSKGRGAKSTKAYISLFVCMVTRAFHVELVSSLTTQAFLAALRRFVARRGRCAEMWSDHGTNFVGAKRELMTMWRQGQSRVPDEFIAQLEDMRIKWKYIPPAAPNFGGLWEAGVKSIKYHMKRVIGNSTLTFEEMATLLTQIEACLNSRPLYPLNDDPDSLQPLTPGHFLTCEQIVSIPDDDYTDFKIHQLSRWQLTQKLLHDFWAQWQKEYLTRLQQRMKWNRITKELDIGDLVLVKDQRLPPGNWPMGRIVEKHSGPDGLTRTYDIKTISGVMQRPITKLCILPVSKDNVLSGGVCSSS
jgi:hypothetical protein